MRKNTQIDKDMNKDNWTTVILDGGLSDEMVFGLIKKSYLLSGK